MKKVLMLCGGQSPEHEISIRSAQNIREALDKKKYEVYCIGISKSGKWQLLNSPEEIKEVTNQGDSVSITPGQKNPFVCANKNLDSIDVVFPVLHGPNGEDGAIQGLLQLLGVPYVGTGLIGSAVSMDKDICKRLLRVANLNVAEWQLLEAHKEKPGYEEISKQLGRVLFVKPANMGSSVGVSRVSGIEEWQIALDKAFQYDAKVLVEQAIEGRELECAVLGNTEIKTTSVGEVVSTEAFYSYDQKYSKDSSTETRIPAKIDRKYIPDLRKVAGMAYQVLNCKGLSRVDMFLREDGEIYVNEVNSMPGFTSISMYPKLWEAQGVTYKELLDQLISLALE